MRVLVTGWAGYIGPVVVRRLREAGHYIVGLDTGWYIPNYAGRPEWPDVAFAGDIRFSEQDAEALDPDAVVHLAGLSNDPLGDLDPRLTDHINRVGTFGIAQSVGRLARHVVVSSCSVYGASPDEATEDTPVNPLTPYARAKADVDEALPHSVRLRLGTVYGYSPGHRLDLVVNRMAWDALATGLVTATGNAWRPLVHVEDVADAVLWAIDAQPGIYNIVGENRQMAALSREVARYAGVSSRFVASGADARDYRASGAKAAAAGWRPKRTVTGSLPVLFERTATLPARDYTRLGAIKSLIESGVLDRATLRRVK